LRRGRKRGTGIVGRARLPPSRVPVKPALEARVLLKITR
jgi:hypothetical protein